MTNPVLWTSVVVSPFLSKLWTFNAGARWLAEALVTWRVAAWLCSGFSSVLQRRVWLRVEAPHCKLLQEHSASPIMGDKKSPSRYLLEPFSDAFCSVFARTWFVMRWTGDVFPSLLKRGKKSAAMADPYFRLSRFRQRNSGDASSPRCFVLFFPSRSSCPWHRRTSDDTMQLLVVRL